VTKTSPFLYLSLDLPSTPLYKDAFERTIIPQVPLEQLMKRFDGSTQTFVRAERRKHVFTRLPPYVILHFKRFSKNKFFVEKNLTSVAVCATPLFFPFVSVLHYLTLLGCCLSRSPSY